MDNRVAFKRVEVDGVAVDVSTIELFRFGSDGPAKSGEFETMFFIDDEPGHPMHAHCERHGSLVDAVHRHDEIVLDLESGVWPS